MSSPSGSPDSLRLFFFSALRFHGKNGWMSVGTLPPAAAQCVDQGEFREIKERAGITAIAIRQACLNKLGLSALATRERSTGERRRVGRNGWICPQESPGSAHNEIEGSLVEIGPRSVIGKAHPAFRGVGVTSSSISAPSNALPRFRTL